jgi:hypothetical protein
VLDTNNQDNDLKGALENAKFAALTSRACTEQANALVDYVMGLLPEVKPQHARGAHTLTQASSGGGASKRS